MIRQIDNYSLGLVTLGKVVFSLCQLKNCLKGVNFKVEPFFVFYKVNVFLSFTFSYSGMRVTEYILRKCKMHKFVSSFGYMKALVFQH